MADKFAEAVVEALKKVDPQDLPQEIRELLPSTPEESQARARVQNQNNNNKREIA